MIRNHSHYSLLMSTSRSKQIAKACKDAGYKYAGITDVATISGCVNFIQACKKEDITPLIGSEIILDDNSRLTLICRNIEAWDDLLLIISLANSKDNHDGTPKISFADLTQNINPSNFICIDGYVGSQLFSKLFSNIECIFDAADIDTVKSCIDNNWKEILDNELALMHQVFPHYYLEVNNFDSEAFPISKVMTDILSKYDNVIPDTSSYYPERKDAFDHRVLICTKLKTTMRQLDSKINNSKDIDLLKFIRSGSYYIKTKEAIEEVYTEKQVENLDKITELCAEINILSKPKLPRFETPDGSTEDEYLKELCRKGWKNLIMNNVDPYKYDAYKDRVLKELDVIQKANLAGYFLIVQDYVNHFRGQGCLVGPGRGCFLPDSRVKMADGLYRPIIDVNIGDNVIDAYTNKQQVLDKFIYDIDEEIVELEMENGKIIRCTKDHKFLTTNRGWVEASELDENDNISEI